MTAAPHWTAYLTPVLQFLAALMAVYVAYRFGTIQARIAKQQAATAAAAAKTAQNRLKFDLFERRMAMYDLVYAYIDEVVSVGKLVPDTDSKFLTAVRAVGWLTDETVTNFIFKALRNKMSELSLLKAEIETTPEPGPIRVDLSMRYSVLKMNLYNEHENLARIFEPFLKLEG